MVIKLIIENMIKALLFLLFPTLVLGQLNKDKSSALQVHNDARKEVGVLPLVWSKNLEDQALKYAKQIARTNNYEHSDTKDGENLAMFYEFKNLMSLKHIFIQRPRYMMLQWVGIMRSKIISIQKLNVTELGLK